MAGDELENRTWPLAHHPGLQLKDTIFVTPHAAALVAAAGREVIAVDPRVASEPEVVSWLNLKIKNGAKVVIEAGGQRQNLASEAGAHGQGAQHGRCEPWTHGSALARRLLLL